MKSLNQSGFKDDLDKPDMDLVLSKFSRSLTEVGRVGTFGAKKYCRDGWLTVEDGVCRYSSAMLRHYFSEQHDNVIDKETGLLHAAHLAWNALARLELLLKEKEKHTIGEIHES